MKFIAPTDLPLIETLKLMHPESSLTTLRSWIKESRVTVDGIPAKQTKDPVLKGQTLELRARQRYMEGGLKIVYEDSDLIVIDKPSGVLSVATAFDKTKTAHAYLKNHYKPKPIYVVHRLDQDTSGVLLFIFKNNIYQKMKKMFEKHEIDRIYYAVVEGRVLPSKGVWQSYLFEDANYHVHSTDSEEHGVLAVTHYEVIESTKAYSLLQLKLETGRKNQIRVHCQQAGHPIIGDKKYGARSNPLKRLGLHAYSLSFLHPGSHKKMTFSSPIPDKFHEIFRKV